MFKPCPNCGFLVALIAGREASQRCPRCGSAMLEDGELPPVEDAADAAPRRHSAVRADAASAQDSPAQRDARSEAQADAIPPAADEDTGPPAQPDEPAASVAPGPPERTAPSFIARQPSSAPRGRRWPWAVALPLLALLLGLQLLLSQRVELARDATWRPLVMRACGLLGCNVPPWREPAAFAMLARNVRPHPAQNGLLQVTASLRNDAAWPQPLPVVVLSLSDVDGRVLAARAVAPGDYGAAASALVGPRDSVDIAFVVREPSPRVVSFQFELR